MAANGDKLSYSASCFACHVGPVYPLGFSDASGAERGQWCRMLSLSAFEACTWFISENQWDALGPFWHAE
jgi:hypothetical protein